MTDPCLLELAVTEVRAEAPGIRLLTLERPDGAALPNWEAGAHINVALPSGEHRSYSLVNWSVDSAAMARPLRYHLGVRLETPSRGGSLYMHALGIGDRLRITPPSNNFALQPSSSEIVLLAGGIGITPLLSMAATLAGRQARYRLIYAARARDQFALLPEIRQLAGEKLSLHSDEDAGLYPVGSLIDTLQNDEPLYVCGPGPMIDAAIAAAKARDWPEGRLKFEIFTPSERRAGDVPFEVVLASSGKSYLVPADKSILAVLLEAGVDALYDCQRGDCGICRVGVIEGVPDHRDYILSDSERSAGTLMQICVSRAKTPRLVINL